jgi:TonB family protein
MGDAPKDWEGQIVDGIFSLKKYLGGSDHSAVFLTEYAEGEGGRAALKLLPAERATADLQLTNWRFTAQLAHPNLLRLFRAGRCRIEGNDLLYVVMEFADEDLADILLERALTPEETRDMLDPVLDALEYLHGKGLVHGDLKPANILAAGEHLKLSTDMISRAGETHAGFKKTSVYDAPEAITGMKASESDVWALGTTLVEVLTQKVPDWQPGPNREPVVPTSVPEPFWDIARRCLRLEPQRRVTVADIAERLNSKAAAASAIGSGAAVREAATSLGVGPSAAQEAAAAMAAGGAAATAANTGVGPIASAAATARAPMTEAGAAGTSKVPTAANAPARARPTPRASVTDHSATSRSAPSYNPSRSAAQPEGSDRHWTQYFAALVAAVAVVLAIWLAPKLFRRDSSSSAKNIVAEAAKQPSGESVAAKAKQAGGSKAATGSLTKKGRPVTKSANSGTTASVAPAPRDAGNMAAATTGDSLRPASDKGTTTAAGDSSAVGGGTGSATTVQPMSARSGVAKGGVLDQVTPDISPKARATIHGHVRVGVKVHVDAAGAVTDAALDSPGPSAFFADAALKAARQWAFTPPEVNGKSVPSNWVLQFVFTSADTKVTPTQTAP